MIRSRQAASERPAGHGLRALLSAGAALALGACAVGPTYHRPSVDTPAAFAEAEGWSPARPMDAVPKGAWWTVFGDPALDDLERRVNLSNQTLAAAQAQYREARALVAEDQASLFPSVSLGFQPSGSGRGNRGATTRSYPVAAEASWAPDLWGRIRRTVESAKAEAEASAADLENARLAAQSQLATDYFQVRLLDAEAALLASSVDDDTRALEVTENSWRAGVATPSALESARIQLASAKTSLLGLGQQRAQAEHAIAVLIGVPPAAFSLPAAADYVFPTPPTPETAPARLLERRPDIAAAERAVASANAEVGIATSAFFPNVTLTGSYGASASSLARLFTSSNLLWSLGADVSETVLDFGARRANLRSARAGYDAAVANYRETTLNAFAAVEDALAAARVLQAQSATSGEAAAAAVRSETVSMNEYAAGVIDYTALASAQTAAVSARVTKLETDANRDVEAVDLIEALGGGWSEAAPVPR